MKKKVGNNPKMGGLKLLFALGVVGGLAAVINNVIFRLAQRKYSGKLIESFYNWRHGKIRYVTVGSGEPLLLVHGIGAGASLCEWENNIMELSRKYRVYALDLLGFGKSSKPDISYSAYLYITLINDFIEDIIGQEVHIAGSSNGADYAVMAYSFKPQLYKSLLLISPAGINTTEFDVYPKTGDLFMKWLVEAPVVGTSIFNFISSRYNIRTFLEKYGYYDKKLVTCREVNKFYYPAHYGGVSAKVPFAAFMSKMLNVCIESKVAQIKVPVMVVWGKENVLNPIDGLRTIERINPKVESTIFENARLMPHSEHPRAFNDLCKRFFG